jgi:transposase
LRLAIKRAVARSAQKIRSRYLYPAPNLVERFFNKIKQCWRIATRYDKLAINYLAFIKLVSIRIRPRVYESAPFS